MDHGMSGSAVGPRATRREWIGLAVLTLAARSDEE